MTVHEEMRVVSQIFHLEHDERIQHVLYGWVTGGDVKGRRGILFTTQYRVGVSSSAGWFSDALGYWVSYDQVINVEINDNTEFRVRTDRGDLVIGSVEYQSHNWSDISSYIQAVRNQVGRPGHFSLIEMGYERLEQNDITAARGYANKVLVGHDESVQALLLLAEVEVRAENIGEAIKLYHRAMHVGAANRQEIRSELAKLNLVNGDLRQAIEEANIALEYGEDAEAIYWRGIAKWNSRDLPGAVRDLRRAVDLQPDNTRFWEDLAKIHLDQNNIEGAQEVSVHLEELGESKTVDMLSSIIAAHRKYWSKSISMGQSALRPKAEYNRFAYCYIDACRADDPQIGIDALPILDSHHQRDVIYQFKVSRLLLDGHEEQEVVTRVQKIRENLGPDFSWEAEPDFYVMLEVVEATAKYMSRGTLMSKADIEHLRETSTFERMPPKLGDTISGTLLFWEGLREFVAGRFQEALRCFEQANVSEALMARAIDADLNKKIEQAHHFIAAKQFDVSGEGRQKAENVPLYQVLNTAYGQLRNSHELPELENRVHALVEQFDSPPLVAVMGEYSVGKSTFINALLGDDLLPTGEGVTTGTIVWLRYGEQQRARVVYRDGRVSEQEGINNIATLVKETEEGQTAKDIRHVEFFLDAPMLRKINIIDTPGLNAPFPEHESTTEEFLEKSDAILFLFNIEAAGKASEGEFLSKVDEHRRKAVAIVNQIDLVPKFEIDDVLEFIAEEFEDLFLEVRGVSGKLALDGALENDEGKRERSRLPGLVSYLDENILKNARTIKVEATREKLIELLADAESECQRFQEEAEDTKATIERYSKRLSEWRYNELDEVLREQRDVLRTTFSDIIDEVSVDLAERSQGGNPVPSSVIRSFVPTLQNRFIQMWRVLAEEVKKEYIEVISDVNHGIQQSSISSGDRNIGARLGRLDVFSDSWEIHLYKSINNVVGYSDGFFDGGGLERALAAIGQEKGDNPKEISGVLADKLGFAVEKPPVLVRSWCREWLRQFDDEIYKIRREIRQEMTRVVHEVYWPLIRLKPLCSTDFGSVLSNTHNEDGHRKAKPETMWPVGFN